MRPCFTPVVVAAVAAATMTLVGCSSSPAPTTLQPAVTGSSSPTPATTTLGATTGPSGQVSPPARRFNFPPTKPLPPDVKVPVFSGPYASDFETAYRQSTSELQRTILTDGRITQLEFSSLQDQLKTCLESNGATNVSFTMTELTVTFPQDWSEGDKDELMKGCQESVYGTVDMLYQSIARNPDNQDEAQIMADCLVRVGVAPKGYTADDYKRDVPDKFPFDMDDPRFGQCVSDPLHAGR